MGTLTVSPGRFSPDKYGELLAKTQPGVIQNDRDLERFSELLESLDRLERKLTPEERTLEKLLSRLIADYDESAGLPELPVHQTIAFLMEQRGLRQTDMLPVFGSRSVASDVLNARREPGKSHIRKLAEFFHLSPAAFF